MVGGILGQGNLGVVLPASHGVRAVGDIGGRIGCPGFVGNDILAYREVAREGQQLVPVGNGVVQGHFQGLVIDRGDGQIIRIALHDFEHIAIVGAQRAGGSALPREFEITGGDRLAVRPGQAVLQRVGVGDGAIFIGNALGQFGRAVGNDLEHAVVIQRPGGQTGEQVRSQRRAVHGRVQCRVNRIRFRSDANSHGAAFHNGSSLSGSLGVLLGGSFSRFLYGSFGGFLSGRLGRFLSGRFGRFLYGSFGRLLGGSFSRFLCGSLGRFDLSFLLAARSQTDGEHGQNQQQCQNLLHFSSSLAV